MKNFRHFFTTSILLSLFSCGSCQNKNNSASKFEYPIDYPDSVASVIQQLNDYPLPRYLPGNHLLRLFSWMDPGYLASRGQPGIKNKDITQNDYLIQKELITDWNYGIIIPNATAFQYGQKGIPVELKLANEYPTISLDVVTFSQNNPARIMTDVNGKIRSHKDQLPPSYFITFRRDMVQLTEIKFNYPDSLLRLNGEFQKENFIKMIGYLKRPINRINDNGEEQPTAYLDQYIKNDTTMIAMKDSMKISSWKDFAATRKLQMRNVYSSTFLNELPELKNTFFSFYNVEGGPIDRFKWSILKKCMTPINGIYYSTPDFYPRWAKNWKDWDGPWHGWKWIAIGRKTEIEDGDYLFSPFVAAGWSKKNEDNITPGQWLGLLKSLSVVGAEFYYVGYFNLNQPFNKPADYIWQAAMPAYAQAITSRFEDVLKNGNVLFDKNHQPIISYPTDDKHVLITARKENNKEKYVICGTYQPFSNDSTEISENKNVNVTIDNHNLSFEIRRQGSVYIYEKTPDNRTIFYQLDAWHEDKHPERWSKDFNFEAEVADSGITANDIYTTSTNDSDFTHFTSYIGLTKNKECAYNFGIRDSISQPHFLWMKCKGDGAINISIKNENGKTMLPKTTVKNTNWKWIKIIVPEKNIFVGNNTITFQDAKGFVDMDKFIITTNEKLNPDK